MSTNVTKKELMNAIKKEANKKIENNQKLSAKEIKELQKSQRDISTEAYSKLKKVASEDFKITSIDDTMRVKTNYFRSVEVCNKKSFTTLYISTKLKSATEMKKLYNEYKKLHKSAFNTVDTEKFLASKDFNEKHRIQLRVDTVVSDKMKKDIIEALKELSDIQTKIEKARKKA